MSGLDWLADQPGLIAIALALVHFLWQGAAIGLISAVLLGRLAGAAATVRYAAGIACLAAMLLAPIATALVLYDTAPSGGGWLGGWAGQRDGVAAGGSDLDRHTRADAAPRTIQRGPTSSLVIANAIKPSVDVFLPSDNAAATAIDPRWLGLVLAGWLVGVVVMALRLLGGWMLARHLARRAALPAAVHVRALAAVVAARLGIRRLVAIVESSSVSVPTLIGWVRPVVLFPAAALAGLSPSQLEAILAHELAHVRRHDYLVNLLQSAVETLLFYHPAVWWVSARVREEREHCCDDLAVGVCGDRLTYASALAELASIHVTPRVALAATDGSLIDRVRRILGRPRPSREPAPPWAALLLMVGVASVAASFGASAAVTPAGALTLAEQTLLSPAAPVLSARQAPVGPGPVGPTPPDGPIGSGPVAPARLSGPGVVARAGLSSPGVIAPPGLSSAGVVAPDLSGAPDRGTAPGHVDLQFDTRSPQIPEIPPTPPEPPEPPQPPVPPTPPAPPAAPVPPPPASPVRVQRPPVPPVPPEPPEPPQPPEPPEPPQPPDPGVRGSGNMSWSNNGDRLRVEWTGPFRLSDDERDIVSVEPGARVTISDGWLMPTSVEFRGRSDGTVERRYRRNGFARDYDAEAREWVATTLARIIRETGLFAEQRVANLLKQGGPPAVFAAIDRLGTDSSYVKRRYYQALLAQATNTEALLDQVLTRATKDLTSDYELASLLRRIVMASQASDQTRIRVAGASRSVDSDYEQRRVLRAVIGERVSEPVAAAVLVAAAGLSSAYERASLLTELARKEGVTATTVKPYVALTETVSSSYEQSRILQALATTPHRAVAATEAARASSKIESDYEQRRVLRAVLAGGELTPELSAATIAAAPEIQGAYERGLVLIDLATRGGVTDQTAAAFFKLVAGMPSSYEQRKVLTAVAARPGLSAPVLTALIETAGTLSSDYERAQALIGIATHQTVTGAARDKYLDAATAIGSDHEQTRALAALVRAERRK